MSEGGLARGPVGPVIQLLWLDPPGFPQLLPGTEARFPPSFPASHVLCLPGEEVCGVSLSLVLPGTLCLGGGTWADAEQPCWMQQAWDKVQEGVRLSLPFGPQCPHLKN